MLSKHSLMCLGQSFLYVRSSNENSIEFEIDSTAAPPDISLLIQQCGFRQIKFVFVRPEATTPSHLYSAIVPAYHAAYMFLALAAFVALVPDAAHKLPQDALAHHRYFSSRFSRAMHGRPKFGQFSLVIIGLLSLLQKNLTMETYLKFWLCTGLVIAGTMPPAGTCHQPMRAPAFVD